MLQASLRATTFTLTSEGKRHRWQGNSEPAQTPPSRGFSPERRELATPRACVALQSRLLHSCAPQHRQSWPFEIR